MVLGFIRTNQKLVSMYSTTIFLGTKQTYYLHEHYGGREERDELKSSNFVDLISEGREREAEIYVSGRF